MAAAAAVEKGTFSQMRAGGRKEDFSIKIQDILGRSIAISNRHILWKNVQ